MKVAREVLESMAERALARLPASFRRLLYNVQIEVLDFPGSEAGQWDGSQTLLGLYKGLTREQMKSPFSGSYMPARIILYQRNLERCAADEAALEEQVDETLCHEIAHHLGFDEDGVRRAMRRVKPAKVSRTSARSAKRPRGR